MILINDHRKKQYVESVKDPIVEVLNQISTIETERLTFLMKHIIRELDLRDDEDE